jgi:hypothetical protein
MQRASPGRDTAEQAAMSRYALGLSDLVSRIEALGGQLEQRSTKPLTRGKR